MLNIKKFVFSPFAVNTYVLYDETGECAVVDPACYHAGEEQELSGFIDRNRLKLKRVFNTHGHIDHIFGNAYMQKTYQVGPEIHEADQFLAENAPGFARAYALEYTSTPPFARYIAASETISFGNIQLETLLIPGHSPGSIVLRHDASKTLLSGDVLFAGSIGRTDLPGGNYNDLIREIRRQLMCLPGDYQVLPGHGDNTTIGHEESNNVFLQ